MFLPDYTKRLFFNVPTLFIECADTFRQMCRHIAFFDYKCREKILSGADINSEQRELRLLLLDALASLVVILLVELKADEVTLLFNTSNGGGATAHTVV